MHSVAGGGVVGVVVGVGVAVLVGVGVAVAVGDVSVPPGVIGCVDVVVVAGPGCGSPLEPGAAEEPGLGCGSGGLPLGLGCVLGSGGELWLAAALNSTADWPVAAGLLAACVSACLPAETRRTVSLSSTGMPARRCPWAPAGRTIALVMAVAARVALDDEHDVADVVLVE